LTTPEVELSSLALDPTGKLRRESPRPWYLRQPGYDDAFDWRTIFYDVFRSADARHIVLIGPSLRNLAGPVCRAIEKAFGESRSALSIRTLDRNDQIRLASDAAAVTIDGLGLQRHLAVQPNLCERFRGKRVAYTMSRDNELRWIRDWACFYVRKHGCNAVLLYDNNSARYTKSDIARALAGIPGLDTVGIVGWPYKFGPGGGRAQLWDSDFSQYGALEHARHRFLDLANACVHADIDELVTTSDRSSVFDRVSNSTTGYIWYGGEWVENVRAQPPDAERRHAQFRYRLPRSPTPVRPKWAVVPARCPPKGQWRVHDVAGMRSDVLASQGVATQHFRAINTNWKFERWRPAALTADHRLDADLAWWLDGLDG
jgi:hypothetical protein